MLQTLMRSGNVKVGLDIRFQNATQLSLAEYDHVVQAFPAHRSEEALADWIQIGRARWELRGRSRNQVLNRVGDEGPPPVETARSGLCRISSTGPPNE